jgi:hypothetical protein
MGTGGGMQDPDTVRRIPISDVVMESGRFSLFNFIGRFFSSGKSPLNIFSVHFSLRAS